MSDELQKIGYDTSRTLIEAGDVDREPIYNAGVDEISLLYSGTTTHYPSQERLADVGGTARGILTETLTSGAQIIGVLDDSFSQITGNTDLQSTLKSIDTLFATTTNYTSGANIDISAGVISLDTSILMVDGENIGCAVTPQIVFNETNDKLVYYGGSEFIDTYDVAEKWTGATLSGSNLADSIYDYNLEIGGTTSPGNNSVFFESNLDVTSGFVFRTTTTGSTNDVLEITHNGLIGINMTPTYTLDTYNATANTLARFQSGTNRSKLIISDDDTDFTLGSEDGYGFLGGTTLATSLFNVNLTSGYTGFGITPLYPMDVYSAVDNTIARFKSGDNRGAILISDDDTDFYIGAQNGYGFFGAETLATSLMTINLTTGYTGIGTDTPESIIHSEEELTGISRHILENTSTASASVVGALYEVRNDNGYWGGIGMTSSGSTIGSSAFINTFQNYNQGYGNFIFTNDGNVDFKWYSDPTDSHDFSALSNEIMSLSAAGSLTIDAGGDVTLNSSSGNAKFSVDSEGVLLIGDTGGEIQFELSDTKNLTIPGNLRIPDAGTIGSASEPATQTFSSNGDVTYLKDILQSASTGIKTATGDYIEWDADDWFTLKNSDGRDIIHHYDSEGYSIDISNTTDNAYVNILGTGGLSVAGDVILYAGLYTKGRNENVNDTVKTANYTLLSTDENIFNNTTASSFWNKLPATPTAGDIYTIFLDAAVEDLTIDGNGKNINGSSTVILSSVGSVTVIYNGTQWMRK